MIINEIMPKENTRQTWKWTQWTGVNRELREYGEKKQKDYFPPTRSLADVQPNSDIEQHLCLRMELSLMEMRRATLQSYFTSFSAQDNETVRKRWDYKAVGA